MDEELIFKNNIVFVNKNYLTPMTTFYTNEHLATRLYFNNVHEKNAHVCKNISLVFYDNDSNFLKTYYYDVKSNKQCVAYKNGTREFISFDITYININGEEYISSDHCVKVIVTGKNNNGESTQTNRGESIQTNNGESVQTNSGGSIRTNNGGSIQTNKAEEYKNLAESFLSFDPKTNNKNVIANTTKPEKKSVKIVEENNTVNDDFDDIVIINDDIDINNYKKKNTASTSVARNNITSAIKNENETNITENKNETNITENNMNINESTKKEKIKEMIGELTEEYFLLKKKDKIANEKITILNKKLEKLDIERKTNIFSNLRRMRDEYLQYKKLKFRDTEFTIEKDDDDVKPPHIFTKKYNFICKACKNVKIKELFEKTLYIDIEKLFYDLNIDGLDKNILLLCESYGKLKKELHLKFDSDYDYMEDEITIQSNNI